VYVPTTPGFPVSCAVVPDGDSVNPVPVKDPFVIVHVLELQLVAVNDGVNGGACPVTNGPILKEFARSAFGVTRQELLITIVRGSVAVS
jgi:hypothetical protein